MPFKTLGIYIISGIISNLDFKVLKVGYMTPFLYKGIENLSIFDICKERVSWNQSPMNTEVCVCRYIYYVWK